MDSGTPPQATGPAPLDPARRKRRWPYFVLGLAAVGLLVLIASTGWLSALGARPGGARLARMQRSPNWGDGAFRNPTPTDLMPAGSFWRTARMQLFGHEQREPPRRLAPQQRSQADFDAPAGLRATWIGHATVILEIDGRRVLTDPIWSERGSPSTLVGPARFSDPPLPLSELPPLDAVVISHDHYDHLDMQTIQQLRLRPMPFIVPLGVGAHLEAWGVPPGQIVELDWREQTVVSGLTIWAMPARHFSGRSLIDTRRTLWASFVIAGPGHKVFYTGDSGYFPGYKEIGAAHGPFDLTLVKVGAYSDNWPDIHLNPEQAIQVQGELRGQLLLPVHWGTFNLALHDWYEPAERLVKAAQAAGVQVVVPRPGERVDASAPPAEPRKITPWWRME